MGEILWPGSRVYQQADRREIFPFAGGGGVIGVISDGTKILFRNKAVR